MTLTARPTDGFTGCRNGDEPSRASGQDSIQAPRLGGSLARPVGWVHKGFTLIECVVVIALVAIFDGRLLSHAPDALHFKKRGSGW